MTIKSSRKAWDDGMRVERVLGSADVVISTDYSRYGYGGAWDAKQREAERKAALRREVSPALKAAAFGALAALVIAIGAAL